MIGIWGGSREYHNTSKYGRMPEPTSGPLSEEPTMTTTLRSSLVTQSIQAHYPATQTSGLVSWATTQPTRPKSSGSTEGNHKPAQYGPASGNIHMDQMSKLQRPDRVSGLHQNHHCKSRTQFEWVTTSNHRGSIIDIQTEDQQTTIFGEFKIEYHNRRPADNDPRRVHDQVSE
jgi:hypothetical protein